MIDLASCHSYLQSNEQVSLAGLQLHLGCGYLQAKEMLQQLRLRGWVSSVTQGLYSRVNSRYFIRRSLTLEEIRTLSATLSVQQLTMLDIVQKAHPKGGYRYDPETDKDGGVKAALEKLTDCDLIYAFEGVLFLAIDDDSAQTVQSIEREKKDAPMLLLLAMPLVQAVIDGNADVDLMERIPMLPESCKQFVLRSIYEYRNKHILPQPILADISDAEGCKLSLAMDLLNAAILHCGEGAEKERVMRAARMSMRIMRNHCIWGETVHEAVSEATNLISGLSTPDIHEIYNNLMLDNAELDPDIFDVDDDDDD